MIAYTVPLFLRGRVITSDMVPFDTRVGAAQFQAPDMSKYVEQLPLKRPAEMSDLYELSFEEILDVLEALGDALDFDTNTHLQEAYEAWLVANVLPPAMMQNSYRILRPLFSRDNVTEIADSQVGPDYLNGWVPRTLHDGRETAGACLRIAGAAYPGRQRRAGLSGDHSALGDHPVGRAHQGAVQ